MIPFLIDNTPIIIKIKEYPLVLLYLNLNSFYFSKNTKTMIPLLQNIEIEKHYYSYLLC